MQIRVKRKSKLEIIQSQEGKERRSKSKTAFLGITYGMSSPTLAKRMQLPLAEATDIVEAFYEGFKGVDKFTKDSQEMAKKLGYVTNIYGRRRHLPDAQLPAYTIEPIKKKDYFNPLLGAKEHDDKQLKAKIKSYEAAIEKTRSKQARKSLQEKAKEEGFIIRNNGAFISRALRQTLNARIQGTAATMTKAAMILINNDPELKALGAKLLVTIHDEVFCEAPLVNKDRVAERLCDLMVTAAKQKCSFTPWSVDPYIVTDGWYEDENESKIYEIYEKVIKKGKSEEEALSETQNKFTMFNPDSITLICHKEYKIGRDSLIYGPSYYVGK